MRLARSLAAWLLARDFHAVIGLALTLLLPFAQILTGAAITVLVLARGLTRSLLLAAIAAALVGVMSLITGAQAVTILVNALMFWLPAAAVAALLKRTRSLTLVVQVAAIVAILGVVLIHVAIADPVAFWKGLITELATAFREMGLEQQAGVLVAQQDMLAPQMTVLLVATTWSLVVLVLTLGYGLYQTLPGNSGRFGRFSDVDLGRVLAMVAAATALLALATGAGWLQNVALLGFAMFWVQGLAVLHWFRVDGPLPLGVLIVVYGLLPVLNVLLVMALAVFGFSDAWFDFRARARRGRGD